MIRTDSSSSSDLSSDESDDPTQEGIADVERVFNHVAQHVEETHSLPQEMDSEQRRRRKKHKVWVPDLWSYSLWKALA